MASSAHELSRRTAILRRLRELLIQQSDRFHSYIASLEKQQTAIESGNEEELFAHIELEEQIVTDIFSIQKVIDPLEILYNAHVSSGNDITSCRDVSFPADDIPGIKASLNDLKNQAVKRSAHNRDLLSMRMNSIRSEMIDLKNNAFAGAARPRYYHSGVASVVDIEG